MNPIRATLNRLVLTGLLVGLLTIGLAGCGGGGGDKDSPASGPQGIRFAIDPSYTEMVYSVDITGPSGTTKETLGLSPGQEMFFSLPTGSYSLQFWIHVGNGMSVVDHTLRHTSVQPSQVTQVIYP